MKRFLVISRQLSVVRGFTLVELMVVIAIIAILSVVGVASYANLTRNARDSVRKDDLKKLSLALGIYFEKNGQYPKGDTTCSSNERFYSDISPFMAGNNVPKDPLNGSLYCYKTGTWGTALSATLENCDDPQVSNRDLCHSNPYPWNYEMIMP